MRLAVVAMAMAGCAALTAPDARAEPLCAAPWQRLGDGAVQFARPYPLGLTLAAALPPTLMSPTGADHQLRRFVQQDLAGSYHPEPVSVAAPYVFYPLSFAFYAGSAIFDYCPGQTRSSAIIQATTETLLLVGLVKWTTGRTWPLGGRSPNDPEVLEHPEDARSWAPFDRGLAAFPSGHTAFFFAVASAFRAASPDLPLLRYVGYPIGATVGFLMWYGDHHWASDVLSGALLGEAIGSAAGAAWRPKSEDHALRLHLIPIEAGFSAQLSGVL